MTEPDGDLLQSFAEHRDEAAFRTLASRYGGLILHTSLRRTGDRPMAEEVCQNVLCAMSRKAGQLAKDPDRLVPWLHRATLYESHKAMRSESSYRRRKQLQEAAEAPEHEEASSWSEAVPHLDLALDRLPESDRRVLLLRFFESRSFAKIAELLGKTPAAVQKQSERALEKLSRMLRAKGVTLSAAVIAGGPSSEFAKAAPAALIQSSAAAALTGAAKPTTILTLTQAMIAMKPKATIAVAMLICASPLIVQEIAIANTKERVETLHGLALSQPASQREARRGTTALAIGLSSSLDVLVLAQECATAQRSGNIESFHGKLEGLDKETLAKLLRETPATKMNLSRQAGLVASLVTVLGQKDPKLATTTAIGSFEAGSQFRRLMNEGILSVFASWALKDPDGAFAWYLEQRESPKFQVSMLGIYSSGEPGLLQSPLVAAFLELKDSRYREILDQIPQETRSSVLIRAVKAMPGAPDREWQLAYLQVVREMVPEDQRGELVEQLVYRMPNAVGFREAVGELMADRGVTTEEREQFARKVTKVHANTQFIPPDPERMEQDRAAVRKWLEETIPEKADEIYEEVMDLSLKEETAQASLSLQQLRNEPDPSDDRLVHALTSRNMSLILDDALEMAEEIRDPGRRQSTIDYLWRQAEKAPLGK